MAKGKIRHMFPGGNTSLGFFSYYDYILSQEEANRIICIKGGPGVGKSTFMKKIGEQFLHMGYNLEYMHCSSDSESLDGIVIPAKKVALLDGTAPHVVDPKNPGAVDEIINLGDFWDEEGIRKNKDKIMKCNREVRENFKRAYRYIKAAYLIYEDSSEMIKESVNISKINKVSQEFININFKDIEVSDKVGKERKLFASAITPKGLINYLSTVLDTDKVYCVSGKTGTGTEIFLKKIKAAAIERGFDVESFYCALNPLKLEHLIIKDLNISFTTSNEYHFANVKFEECIDFDQYIDKFHINELVLEENKQNFDFLLGLAIKNIGKAKSIHDDIEAYYIPNMDFEAIELCIESTMAKIL
jgi:hypothetical protein